MGSLPFLLLNVFHELLDLFLETLLEFFLHFSIFMELLSRGSDRDLQLFTSILALTNEGLVLGHILLEVIKDLQLLIQSNQRVKFVLELNFFFFKEELQLGVLTLLEHGYCVALSSGRSRRAGGGHPPLVGRCLFLHNENIIVKK